VFPICHFRSFFKSRCFRKNCVVRHAEKNSKTHTFVAFGKAVPDQRIRTEGLFALKLAYIVCWDSRRKQIAIAAGADLQFQWRSQVAMVAGSTGTCVTTHTRTLLASRDFICGRPLTGRNPFSNLQSAKE
jgi:hypothetical protein